MLEPVNQLPPMHSEVRKRSKLGLFCLETVKQFIDSDMDVAKVTEWPGHENFSDLAYSRLYGQLRAVAVKNGVRLFARNKELYLSKESQQ